MALPIDRLARVGATADELAELEALPEAEQDSIAARLVQVAESGVRDFLDQHRARAEAASAPLETPETLETTDPSPEPPETASEPDTDKPANKPTRATK